MKKMIEPKNESKAMERKESPKMKAMELKMGYDKSPKAMPKAPMRKR
jgi:hypothetical protein